MDSDQSLEHFQEPESRPAMDSPFSLSGFDAASQTLKSSLEIASPFQAVGLRKSLQDVHLDLSLPLPISSPGNTSPISPPTTGHLTTGISPVD